MDQPTAPRRGNPAGIASLVAGVLLLLAGIAAQALAPAIPVILAESGMPFRAVPFLFAIPQAVIATVATVFGIIGLLLRDRARVPAIIGTTIGAGHLTVSLAGLLASGVVAAVLS